MGWCNYYSLLEKYNGDLSKATDVELQVAAKRNPNNPVDARALAEKKWRECLERAVIRLIIVFADKGVPKKYSTQFGQSEMKIAGGYSTVIR